MTEEKRCGLVALVGRPNVGKSTLLNHLLGRKLAITSRRPQTTRHKLTGVDTNEHNQILFMDVPGLQNQTGKTIDRYMNKVAVDALSDADVILMLVDRNFWSRADNFVLEKVKQAKTPTFLVINKIDLLKRKTDLLPFIEEKKTEADWDEIIPVAALKNIGLLELKAAIVKRLPISPHLFPEDQITDRGEGFLASEIIREQIMRQIGDEVPYQTTVKIEEMRRDEKKNILHISALIIVAKEGQKGIMIGQGGLRLKRIGQQARIALEQLLECRIMLRVWVKVQANWLDGTASLKALGYGE